MKLKKLIQAGLVAGALTAAVPAAQAAVAVPFTIGGTGGTAVTLQSLDWNFGTIMLDNLAPEPGGDLRFTMRGQARLALFNTLGGPAVVPAGQEYTLVFSVPMLIDAGSLAGLTTVPGVGTFGTVNARIDPLGTAQGLNNYFRIYHDLTADVPSIGGIEANFTGGRQILDARVAGFLNGTISVTLNSGGQTLDSFDGDGGGPDAADQSYPGVLTGTGGINGTLVADVLAKDSTYFTSDITALTTDSTTALGAASPFTSVNPDATVVAGNTVNAGPGVTDGDVYGAATPTMGTRNDFSCIGTSSPCDALLQSDMNTSFTDTPEDLPEPGTLALLGLGAAGIAGLRRRRS